MPKTMKTDTAALGLTGEWFAMFHLSRLGFVASLAPRNAAGIDIFGSQKHGVRPFTLQVKTAQKVGAGWQLSEKNERFEDDRLFYCFIEMGNEENLYPHSWIVPSAIVAEHVRLTHQSWLTGIALSGARKGEQRTDGSRRAFHVRTTNPPLPQYQAGWLDQYREAWRTLL